MTSIKPPRDDEGVVRRRLQRANAAPVGPLRRTAAVGAPRPAAADRPVPQERQPERRRGERRQRREAVLLETRSPVGNRRRGTRRGAERKLPRGGTGGPPAGTLLDDDVYA